MPAPFSQRGDGSAQRNGHFRVAPSVVVVQADIGGEPGARAFVCAASCHSLTFDVEATGEQTTQREWMRVCVLLTSSSKKGAQLLTNVRSVPGG